MSIWKLPMDISEFPSQKRAIFRKIKKIKELRGDVPWYVAQEIPQIATEIAEKGRFRWTGSRKSPYAASKEEMDFEGRFKKC